MMKNETKDSDLPCHTTDPWGRGRVGGGWDGGEMDETTSPQLMPPLFMIKHCLRLRAGPVSLAYLWGTIIGIAKLNIVDTDNQRCHPRKDDRHQRY
jgi:hypothetical protein